MNKRIISVTAVLALFLSACATTPGDPYANTKQNAAVGATVGALAGFFIGDGELDEILGSATVGAGVGAGIGVYMDKQQQELERIDEVDVERIDETTLRVSFDSDILFAFDSAVLSDASRYSLDEFAQVMWEYPQTAIVVQGHTDAIGSEQYNLVLSERRARSVYNHLALRQVDPGRMAAVGYGEGYPVADNTSDVGRQLNRRVSILIRGNA